MTTPSIKEIFADIEAELDYQYDKWGVASDDTRNEPNDWVAYISNYSTNFQDGTFAPYSTETVEKFRTSMTKVATLAVAAILSVDRQRAEGGRCFYEKDEFKEVFSSLRGAVDDLIQSEIEGND